MNILYEYGIKEIDVKNMLEIYPDIIDLTDKEITDKIGILESLKCEKNEIKNIIISNPEYLLRINSDIIKLIDKLLSLGIRRLDVTIDSNPWILNKDVFEIDDFIKEKQDLGMAMDDIIDIIDSGMME